MIVKIIGGKQLGSDIPDDVEGAGGKRTALPIGVNGSDAPIPIALVTEHSLGGIGGIGGIYLDGTTEVLIGAVFEMVAGSAFDRSPGELLGVGKDRAGG